MCRHRYEGDRLVHDRLIRYPEVTRLTGVSRTTLWRWINAGTFPQPHPIGGQAVAFSEQEVQAWIARQLGRDVEVA